MDTERWSRCRFSPCYVQSEFSLNSCCFLDQKQDCVILVHELSQTKNCDHNRGIPQELVFYHLDKILCWWNQENGMQKQFMFIRKEILQATSETIWLHWKIFWHKCYDYLVAKLYLSTLLSLVDIGAVFCAEISGSWIMKLFLKIWRLACAFHLTCLPITELLLALAGDCFNTIFGCRLIIVI